MFPTFDQLLNQYLREQDRSGAWLAEKLGLNPATISHWRNGHGRPGNADLIVLIANLLHLNRVQCDELLRSAQYRSLVSTLEEIHVPAIKNAAREIEKRSAETEAESNNAEEIPRETEEEHNEPPESLSEETPDNIPSNESLVTNNAEADITREDEDEDELPDEISKPPIQSTETFKVLRKWLANCYSDEVSIGRIVDDSGIDKTHINFNNSPLNCWHLILTQASARKKIEDLLTEIQKDYPENQELEYVIAAFSQTYNIYNSETSESPLVEKLSLSITQRGNIPNSVYVNNTLNQADNSSHKDSHQNNKFKNTLRKPTKNFVNRNDISRKLILELQPGEVIILAGMTGIGKTELSKRIAQDIKQNKFDSFERFSDGIIGIELVSDDKNLSIEGIIKKIVKKYNSRVKFSSIDEAIDLLSERRLLIVIDGIDCPKKGEDISKLVAVASGHSCAMLLITQNSDCAPQNTRTIHLDELPEQEAYTLFKNLAQNHIDNKAVAERICALAGYSPLAIVLITCRLTVKDIKVSEYLPILEQALFNELKSADQAGRDNLVIIIELIVSQLGEVARNILVAASKLNGANFTEEMIVNSTNYTYDEARSGIFELKEHGMVRSVDNGWYRPVNLLIYSYVRDNFEIDATLVRRLGNYFLDVIQKSHEISNQIIVDFRQYVPQIVETIHLLIQQKLWEPVIELAEGIYEELNFTWQHSTRIQVIDGVLESVDSLSQASLSEEKKIEYSNIQGLWRLRRGTLCAEKGENELAVSDYLEGLEVVTDLELERQLRKSLSSAYSAINQPENAITALIPDETNLLSKAYSKATQSDLYTKTIENELRKSRRNKNTYGELLALVSLGNYYRLNGATLKAKFRFQSALRICHDLDNAIIEAVLREILGDTYCFLGKLQIAIEHYEKSLSIIDANNNRFRARLLNKLSVPYSFSGDMEKSKTYCHRALEIAQDKDNNDIQNECEILNNLAYLHCDLGKYAQAIAYGQDALKQAKEKYAISELKSVYNLSRIYYYRGYNSNEFQDAVTNGETLLAMSKSAGNLQFQGRALNILGNVQLARRKFEDANKYYNEVFDILTRDDISDPWLKSAYYNNLGLLHLTQKNEMGVLDYFTESKSIAQKCQFSLIRGIVLKNRGNAYKSREWDGMSQDTWKEAYNELAKVQSPFLSWVYTPTYHIAIG